MTNDTMTMADVSAATNTPADASDSSPQFGSSLAEAFKRASAGEPISKAEPKAEPKAEAKPELNAEAKKPDLSFKSDEKPTETASIAEKESRSAKDFKAIKSERDSYKAEIERLRAEVESSKTQRADTGALDSLREERDQLSEQLKSIAVERHPKFKAYYDSRVQQSVEQAKRIAGEHGERLVKLMSAEDDDARTNGLDEIFSDMPASKQAQIGALIASHDAVRAERATAIANAATAYEALQSSEQQNRAQQAEAGGRLFNEVATEAAALEIFQSREGDDAWNGELAERINGAREIFMGQTNERELARAALWAAAAPKYRELLMAQVEINRRLQKQIGDLHGASPSVKGANSAAAPSAPKSFIDRFQEQIGS